MPIALCYGESKREDMRRIVPYNSLPQPQHCGELGSIGLMTENINWRGCGGKEGAQILSRGISLNVLLPLDKGGRLASERANQMPESGKTRLAQKYHRGHIAEPTLPAMSGLSLIR